MDEMFQVQFEPRSWLIRATVLAGSLGMLHLLATPLYFSEWLGYGMIFFTVAVLQVIYSMVLGVNPPNRTVLWVGIAGNALIVAVWIITRTLGVPMGPMAGEVLPVDLLDGLTQVLEVVQIIHLAMLLRLFDGLGRRPLIK